jgi:thiol-disulfide isomerase/thioredoxin
MKPELYLLLPLMIIQTSCIRNLARVDNIISKAQEKVAKDKRTKWPFPFTLNPESHETIQRFEDIEIMYINQQNFKDLLHFSGEKYKLVTLFTSGCGGTPSEMKYLRRIDSLYANQVSCITISSDNIAPYLIQKIQKLSLYFKIQHQVYILDKTIESYLDSRKRGYMFRNLLCSECQTDIIGVPYTILYDRKNQVLFHGYRGYKTTIPSDVVKYFLEKEMK